MLVAQLVELLLPTPEFRGSNPAISETVEKMKIKKKEAINGLFKKLRIFINKCSSLLASINKVKNGPNDITNCQSMFNFFTKC